jgi:hypothetical protein
VPWVKVKALSSSPSTEKNPTKPNPCHIQRRMVVEYATKIVSTVLIWKKWKI